MVRGSLNLFLGAAGEVTLESLESKMRRTQVRNCVRVINKEDFFPSSFA